jgi:PAS domain S-box-containing protein
MHERDDKIAAQEACVIELQSILDKVPMVLYLHDVVEQENVYFNQAVTAFLGYTQAELKAMGRTAIATQIHPDDIAQLSEHHARIHEVEDSKVSAIEYRFRNRAGEWRWIRDRNVVFTRTHDGKVHRILGTIEDITLRKQAEDELRASQSLLQAFIDHSPSVITANDTEGRLILNNHQLDAFFGVPKGGLLGKKSDEYLPPETAERFRLADRYVQETAKTLQDETEIPHQGGARVYLSTRFPIYNSQGVLHAVGCVATDVTLQKQAAAARAAQKEQMIEAQRAIIRELVTPLLPVASGVVVMPLVGTIDATRSQQIIETLLDGVASHQASLAILDITGVKVVDAHVAQALLSAAQGAKLLGAEVVLTGIRAQIAQILVELGADLRGIVTLSTLQSGIAYALKRNHQA